MTYTVAGRESQAKGRQLLQPGQAALAAWAGHVLAHELRVCVCGVGWGGGGGGGGGNETKRWLLENVACTHYYRCCITFNE
jgi:hypothetical protein